VKVPGPSEIDGQSFLPQLLGRKGTPREWLYTWYVRDGGPTATYEYVMTTRYKLYRDGRFFDLAKDLFETNPQQASTLTGATAAEAKKLQAALDRYKNARPAHLMTVPPKSSPPPP
jgi:arylsulfatase A